MNKIVTAIVTAGLVFLCGSSESVSAEEVSMPACENAQVEIATAVEAEVLEISYETVCLDEEDDAVSNEQVNSKTNMSKVTTPDGAVYIIFSTETDVTGCTIARTVTDETILLNAETNKLVVYNNDDVYVYDIDTCTII